MEAEPVKSQDSAEEKKPKVNRRRPPKEESGDDKSHIADGVRPKEEAKRHKKLTWSEMNEGSNRNRLGMNN